MSPGKIPARYLYLIYRSFHWPD